MQVLFDLLDRQRCSKMRRSVLGTVGVAPIRLDPLAETKGIEMRPSRSSIVPRNLSFNSSVSKTKELKRSSIVPVAQRKAPQSLGPHSYLYGKPNPDGSLLDGIQELPDNISTISGVTIASSQSCLEQESTAHEDEDQGKTSKPSNLRCRTKFTISSKKQFSSKEGSACKSLTKIPRANVRKSQPRGQLNSTAAFEEAEMAALTSTPHPNRFHNHVAGDCLLVQELAEQMKLFLTDQRNLMEVLKLTFFKMNVVLDELKNLQFPQNGSYSSDVVKPTPSTTDSTNDNNFAGDNTLLESVDNGAIMKVSESISAACEDKENVARCARKSVSAFIDLKTKNNFLKTPTNLKSHTSHSTETHNRVLSNKVLNQLENLYDITETDQ